MREKTLAIGIDAADPELVERWARDGSLPNLAALFARGDYRRLDPPDEVLLGPPWPSFYSGLPVSEHGLYEYLVWHPDRMQEVRATEWCRLEPFWRKFGPNGPRSVVIDVPLVPPPEPIHGVEVCCWGTHEQLVPFTTHPPALAKKIEELFGDPPMSDELHHPVSYTRSRRETAMLIETTEGVANLARGLLEEERWDFGLVCFSACHRAGHKLWRIKSGSDSAVPESKVSDELRLVYQSVDNAIGRISDVAGSDTNVVAFSLHGMGPNTSCVHILPELLNRILFEGERKQPRGVLGQLRKAFPLEIRGWVKRQLPVAVQDRLSTFWRTQRDWSQTSAIALAADIHGFIRINLAGREAKGVVAAGDYRALCDEIADGLLSFRAVNTGEPLVSRVLPRAELYETGTFADSLPDLIVVWNDLPVTEHVAFHSQRFGTVKWPSRKSNPDGRSGNHRTQGWLVAAGPSIDVENENDGGTILDIAPTVLSLIGQDAPPEMVGRPLFRIPNDRRHYFESPSAAR